MDLFQEGKVPNGRITVLSQHFVPDQKVGQKIPQFFSYYLKLGYWIFLIPFQVEAKDNILQFTSDTLHKVSYLIAFFCCLMNPTIAN